MSESDPISRRALLDLIDRTASISDPEARLSAIANGALTLPADPRAEAAVRYMEASQDANAAFKRWSDAPRGDKAAREWAALGEARRRESEALAAWRSLAAPEPAKPEPAPDRNPFLGEDATARHVREMEKIARDGEAFQRHLAAKPAPCATCGGGGWVNVDCPQRKNGCIVRHGFPCPACAKGGAS